MSSEFLRYMLGGRWGPKLATSFIDGPQFQMLYLLITNDSLACNMRNRKAMDFFFSKLTYCLEMAIIKPTFELPLSMYVYST